MSSKQCHQIESTAHDGTQLYNRCTVNGCVNMLTHIVHIVLEQHSSYAVNNNTTLPLSCQTNIYCITSVMLVPLCTLYSRPRIPCLANVFIDLQPFTFRYTFSKCNISPCVWWMFITLMVHRIIITTIIVIMIITILFHNRLTHKQYFIYIYTLNKYLSNAKNNSFVFIWC